MKIFRIPLFKYPGPNSAPNRHKEELEFKHVLPSQKRGATNERLISRFGDRRVEREDAFQTYPLDNVTEEMSLLEAIDILNEQLIHDGAEPVAFDHDCREGICGTCGCMVNGHAHGPGSRTTLCQLHMRSFDGQTITDQSHFVPRLFPSSAT